MKPVYGYLLLLLIIIYSCKDAQKSNVETDSATHTLKKISEYEIEIDSVTAGNFIHYQHFKQDRKEYFTFLNRITQEINFYDLGSKSLSFKVSLPVQGVNAVGNIEGFNSGYHIHNLDSIFVINRNARRLFILNRFSERIGEIDFSREGYLPTPVLAPFAPMKIIDNQAYFLNIQGNIDYMSRNKEYGSDYATVIDLKTSKQDYFLSYPKSYTKGAWGLALHRISWTINVDNHFVVSYPIDKSLYEFDLNGNLLDTHEAHSNKVESVKSIKKNQMTRRGSQEYYASQGKYGQIFFDSVRNIYLRDAFTSVPEDEVLAGPPYNYERPLIILDKTFKKIGEFDEPSKNQLVLFFNEEGIHKCIRGANEDLLKFEIYELSTI